MHEITEINHRALAQVIAAYRALEPSGPRTVLLLSPSDEDIAFLRGQFPETRLLVATRGTWDLNQPFPAAGRVDLVVASNVFHYSPEPERWFSNVLGMTRYFILQDLIARRRSTAPDGLCDDGDRMRYRFSQRGIESDFGAAYDLSAQAPHIAHFLLFEGGRNEHHAPPLAPPRHFCALLAAPDRARARSPLTGAGYLKYRVPLLRRVWRSRWRRLFGSISV
ncbi:MAG TPA: class I SAM-dependent methyltransferase [Polyangiaceae bacterium]|nr:class I SAM-dependent methyltransferase [Polyangiaceae bacterium]